MFKDTFFKHSDRNCGCWKIVRSKLLLMRTLSSTSLAMENTKIFCENIKIENISVVGK